MDERSSQVRLSASLEIRVQNLRSQLSEKEQAVANFLLSNPKEFVSLSISAIADRCGVSETVIIRLYRKLGYDGFHAFKIDIAQSLTESGQVEMTDLRTGDDMETVKRKVFAASRQALEEAVGSVDTEQLAAARDALTRARRVVVVAFGGSAPVGLDLVHKLMKLGIVATLISDAHMQVMAAAVMGPDDLLVAISHSGNSRDIIDVLQLARKRGVRSVLITGFTNSPAAKVADIKLYALCRETNYQTDAMTSRLVQMALVDTLFVAITFANKEQAVATIRDTSVAAALKKL